MAYRSEIIRALDEMMADEMGMRFQGIAMVHAKQKWHQLVACERKWDGGLDAHADGALQPDGKGIGLACSTTPTLEEIKRDARETNRHYADVRVLIFSTAGKVTKHEGEFWAEQILAFMRFGTRTPAYSWTAARRRKWCKNNYGTPIRG